tara:strand:+ start:417 stop:680 length:264 start_codon:yes stop_codon:yes gene_type:complete
MPPGKDHEPRWNIIDKLYNKVDKALDKAFIDNKCSFLEVEITMLMVQEKLSQQKHELYNMYLESKEDNKEEEEEDKEIKTHPKDIYK